MSTLASELKRGSDAFNARRKAGSIQVDQSGATLTEVFVARVDLSKLDLSNCEFEDCTVGACDFRGASLEGAYLHGSRFESCDFRGVNWDGASLEKVEFVDCRFDDGRGFESVEHSEVEGFGSVTPAAPPDALSEDTVFSPGVFASNPTLERELFAHPDDERRWLVYADWLQGEGDLRGELITRQRKGEGFADFVNEHLEHLFPSCADELRGGGNVPEVVLEWRHGFVHGAAVGVQNRDRPLLLHDVAHRLLESAPCHFLRRLSFGLTTVTGENDYAPVIDALVKEKKLPQLAHLEFGLQEIDPDFDPYEGPPPLEGWGDLSALWSHVPHLRRLRVRGGGGHLGALNLPSLTSVAIELDAQESEVVGEVITARWPKLTSFELWNVDEVEFAPLLQALSVLPLTHLALPFTRNLERLVPLLVGTPLLARLQVLDLRDSELNSLGLAALMKHFDAFRHLQRLDLTNAADEHEVDVLKKRGDFIVLGQQRELPIVQSDELSDLGWDDFDPYAPEADPAEDGPPPPPNADLDIPDEHGDG